MNEGWYVPAENTLIEYADCNIDDQIAPVCITDDPDSPEGWYRGEELVKEYPCGENGTEAECSFDGTRSEGWYKPLVDRVIEYATCSEE